VSDDLVLRDPVLDAAVPQPVVDCEKPYWNDEADADKGENNVPDAPYDEQQRNEKEKSADAQRTRMASDVLCRNSTDQSPKERRSQPLVPSNYWVSDACQPLGTYCSNSGV
jgi:hypothetical protein